MADRDRGPRSPQDIQGAAGCVLHWLGLLSQSVDLARNRSLTTAIQYCYAHCEDATNEHSYIGATNMLSRSFAVAAILLGMSGIATAGTCDIPRGKLNDVSLKSAFSNCRADMDETTTNICLNEQQLRIRRLLENEAWLKAKSKCLCDALAKASGQIPMFPYDEKTGECSL
jgi:hypothetical protein